MKKLLLVLIVLILLAIAGIAFFLATFDADRYRPLIVSKIEEATGHPVRLEHLSAGWDHGIAVQAKGFALEDRGATGSEPLIQIDSASALVDLVALLHKDIRVSSIILRHPQIHVSRDAEGNINLLGLAAAAAPAGTSGKTAAGSSTVSFQVGALRIEDGELHWTDAATSPPTDIRLKHLDLAVNHIVPGQPMNVELRGALTAESQNLHLRARLTPPTSSSRGSIDEAQFSAEHLAIEHLLPASPSGEPQLRGKLTATVQGSVKTLDPSQLANAIAGRGHVKVEEPVIVNLNILRSVFERISILPGLLERLEAHLPPQYQAKLAARDTVLQPIDASAQVENGSLRFDDLHVRTDTFELVSGGLIGFDHTVNLRATLRIEPALSAALVQSVKELQALADRSGQLQIPLTIQGQAPRLAVLPDLNYLASRLLVTKAEDLLGRLLEKAASRSQKTSEPQSPPQ